MLNSGSLAGKRPNPAGDELPKDGLYLYAVARLTVDIPPGMTGINGEPVIVIPFGDMAAILHACPPKPYADNDERVTTEWVLAHQRTLERLLDAGIPVIPFSFDTIIKPRGDQKSAEVLTGWLAEEHEKFETIFDRIRNKKEYGIQVFCDIAKIRDAVRQSDEKVRTLFHEIQVSGPGKEYLLRQKLEKQLKIAADEKTGGIVTGVMEKIRCFCDDVQFAKLKKGSDPDLTMILNCSCLVSDKNYQELGEALEELRDRMDLTVRFTGPWPAYSFVGNR
ncbi:MAG: GvpL/GvpF family gas vesicle protein [Methanoregulaceae archaeon]